MKEKPPLKETLIYSFYGVRRLAAARTCYRAGHAGVDVANDRGVQPDVVIVTLPSAAASRRHESVSKYPHSINQRFLKLCDLIVIALAVALTCFSAWSIYLTPRNTTRVLIEGHGKRWVFPLDAEERIAVPGPLGNTIVRIHDGQAWVESSPCDNQICVAAGRLHKHGEFAACLPNIVFVMIEGRDDLKKPDSVAW